MRFNNFFYNIPFSFHCPSISGSDFFGCISLYPTKLHPTLYVPLFQVCNKLLLLVRFISLSSTLGTRPPMLYAQNLSFALNFNCLRADNQCSCSHSMNRYSHSHTKHRHKHSHSSATDTPLYLLHYLSTAHLYRKWYYFRCYC